MTPIIQYQINVEQRQRHLFNVSLSVPGHKAHRLHLSLPAWIPGSYMIRDFAKNIVAMEAFDEQDQRLTLHKTDKQSWYLDSGGQAVRLEYQVYAFDTSVRTAYVDTQRAFFNGTSLFLRITEFENCPHRLRILPPDNACQWRVATGLKRSENTEKYAFGDYLADDYAQLIDCPVEIGDFSVQEFEVAGVMHHLVLTGKHYADMQRISKDVQKICQHHIGLFEPDSLTPPFTEYWFLTNILPNGFGGLEHKNSTALLCSTFDFATANETAEKSDGYINFLSLVSHEYFHAWNVCRIKPEVFVKPDLSREVHTRQLWAYEGITSYYDDFSLFRCNLISFSEYLKLLQKTLTRVHRGSGQHKQSVSDSSFDAWTRFYQQGEDAINNIVSYYSKGALIALWLDLTIRLHSQGSRSLDDLMRLLWQAHGKTAKGTTDDDFYSLVKTLTDEETAKGLNHLLIQAAPLDLTQILASVGVDASKKPVAARDLLTPSDKPITPYLGLLYKPHALGLEVTAVQDDSPAESASINPGDVILALDNLKLDSTNIEKLCRCLPPNQPVILHLFRDQHLRQLKITPLAKAELAITLTETDERQSSLWKNIIPSTNLE